MRLIVTGGAGFIGCNALASFMGDGHTVLSVDSLARAASPLNAEWLRTEHRIENRVLDLRDSEATARLVRDFAPDVVIHCAGQVAVTSSIIDPRRDFEDNAQATLNVLEALRLYTPRAILLYASTNKVYGAMSDVAVGLRGDRYAYLEMPEGCSEERPLDFHSPYGCSKGAADQYVRDYARIYGLRTVVFRQSCIYGTRQFGSEDQGWVAWFTIRSVQGKPVTVYGDGYQARDVLFIDDLIDAFRSAIARIDVAAGQVFNIGGGPTNTLSLRELLQMLGELNGRQLQVSYGPWRAGDQRVFVSDVSKARRILGWEPRIDVRDGVRRLHRWVLEHAPLHRAGSVDPGD